MTNRAHDAHTLGRWTTDRARVRPEAVAIIDRGVDLTYGELERRAESLASAFRAAGYRRGDRVATLTGNTADHVVAFFACAKAGLVLVPMSWRLTAAELSVQLEHADPAVLLLEEEFATTGGQAVRRLPASVPTARLGESGVESGPPAPWRGSEDPARAFEDPARAPEDPARAPEDPARAPEDPADGIPGPVRDDDPLLMVFTSGSSGRPKAAVLTHATCSWTNLSLSRTLGMSEHDVVLAVLPQFHVGGWNIQPLLAWWHGATVVLERTFDAGRALRLIAERGVTTMMAVPTQYLLMSEHADFATTDFSRMDSAVVGGAPMPAALLRTYHARGISLTQGYGLTEAGPNVLCVPPQHAQSRVGYAGKPYPHVDVAIADPVTGQHLDGPATGELLVRGPGMFAGYFRDPDATRAAWRDGWLATGDVATRESDGYLKIVDRLKNIYISGGENVSVAEVEQALRQLPFVADAAVVGVPDRRWGEVGVALVVPRSGVAGDEAAVLEHARSQLAAYKVPTLVHFVESLPYVGLGKVGRPQVLELAVAAVAERQETR